MTRSRLWLIVTALAFLAWMGYLFSLTRDVERPAVHLSRPQFLIAEAVVIAHLDNRDGPIKATEVVYFVGKDRLAPGDQVDVPHLRESLHKWLADDGPPDWPVPGDFIIPLHGIVNGKDGWRAEVVPLPPSPGSPHGPRIYPVTPGTLQEMRAIPIGLP